MEWIINSGYKLLSKDSSDITMISIELLAPLWINQTMLCRITFREQTLGHRHDLIYNLWMAFSKQLQTGAKFFLVINKADVRLW
jgi:hypothetical protein